MFWRKPDPPPKIWIQKPAWVSIVVTIVVILVLGPVGSIYHGMTEEMKVMKNEDKEQKGAIIQNQLAIKELLTRQQLMIDRKIEVAPPKNLVITGPKATINTQVDKKPLPPDYFEKYYNMKPEMQAKYKKYLDRRGFDTEGL